MKSAEFRPNQTSDVYSKVEFQLLPCFLQTQINSIFNQEPTNQNSQNFIFNFFNLEFFKYLCSFCRLLLFSQKSETQEKLLLLTLNLIGAFLSSQNEKIIHRFEVIASVLIDLLQKLFQESCFSDLSALILSLFCHCRKNLKILILLSKSFFLKYLKDNQSLFVSNFRIWKYMSIIYANSCHFLDFKLLVFSIGYSEKLMESWIKKLDLLEFDKSETQKSINNLDKEKALIVMFNLWKTMQNCEENKIVFVSSGFFQKITAFYRKISHFKIDEFLNIFFAIYLTIYRSIFDFLEKHIQEDKTGMINEIFENYVNWSVPPDTFGIEFSVYHFTKFIIAFGDSNSKKLIFKFLLFFSFIEKIYLLSLDIIFDFLELNDKPAFDISSEYAQVLKIGNSLYKSDIVIQRKIACLDDLLKNYQQVKK